MHEDTDHNEFCDICGKYTGISGDVNDNGRIDSNDYILIRKKLLDADSGQTDSSRFIRADMNGNGKIDSNDCLLVRVAFLGIEIPEDANTGGSSVNASAQSGNGAVPVGYRNTQYQPQSITLPCTVRPREEDDTL